MTEPQLDRIERLKLMYRRYIRMGHPQAAGRVLDRLRELGVNEKIIIALKLEN